MLSEPTELREAVQEPGTLLEDLRDQPIIHSLPGCTWLCGLRRS